MNIKESFNKGIAWVKAHPWAAAGILLLVLLVAWWISKQVKAASPAASSEVAAESPPDLGAGIGGGGGGLLDSFQGQVEASPYPGQAFDSTAPLPMTIPDLPMIENQSLFETGALPSAFYEAPTISNNMLTAESSGLVPSLKSYISSSPAARLAKPTPPVASGMSQASGAVKSAKKPRPQTPAQEVGKSKNFTGLYQGVYYVLGYPTSAINPGTQLGGTISKSPVASMRKPGM